MSDRTRPDATWEDRLRAASVRTGGFLRSVIADDVREAVKAIDAAKAKSPMNDHNIKKEIMRLMREDFDPHPNWELPAGQWDDNAEDVADKVFALFPTSEISALRTVVEYVKSRWGGDPLLDQKLAAAAALRDKEEG